MRTPLCLLLVILGSTGGEVAVTHAMKQIGEVHNFSPRALLVFLIRALKQKWFWAGLGLLALGFFSLLTLLTWADVSLVIPATALSFVVGGLAAKLFLGERLVPMRWAGIALVSIGVALVAMG
ncbi:MAG TPA: EamA family transporter [Terriglobia bacterium]|nr:EamA family transporter [Terriglobia bacterium]